MIFNFNTPGSKPIPRRSYMLCAAAFWSLLMVVSLVWNYKIEKSGTLEAARIECRTALEKDVVYRRWNAMHEGVYAPVTELNQPNPWLDMPERDIETLFGKRLTKINPAYMTRQVHELEMKTYGVRGHITSLNPIRPANAPDPWETRALKTFETGVQEVSSVEEIAGRVYMCLMRPLLMEKDCLKCHAVQGYKLGDVRGGISAAVPMAPLVAVERSHIFTLSAGHGFIWIIGLFGIGFGTCRLRKQVHKRMEAEETLKKLNLELEGRVEQRTADLKKEILERKHAEAELLKSKTKLQAVFDGISASLMMLDKDLKIVMLNMAAVEYYHVRLKEVIGKPCYQAFKERSHPCEGCKIAPAVSNGEHVTFEREGFMDPEKFEQVIIYPIREEYDEAGSAIIRISDITEAKLMQQQLFQSGKLASVGELAAGVAHEINNPINGIINYAQILIDEAEECSGEVNVPGRILKEGERIASIVRNLLSFSRQTDHKVAPTSIQTIVSDTLELMGKQLRNDGIQLELSIPDDLPKLNINSQRMQQVLMNLFSNARDALNQKYHGAHKDKALQIKGALKKVDKETCVSLSVHDLGVGIPAEVIDRICDPFFSAKPVGESSGLGLSISYAIVKDYGGKLLFDSKEGAYTKVTVDLPVSN